METKQKVIEATFVHKKVSKEEWEEYVTEIGTRIIRAIDGEVFLCAMEALSLTVCQIIQQEEDYHKRNAIALSLTMKITEAAGNSFTIKEGKPGVEVKI